MSKINLTLKNVSKSYSNRIILDNISYEFHSNKIYAILGSSGSGKTTLLNILGLLDNNYDGQIFVNDKMMSKKIDNYEFRNERIGFIFQSYYLIDNLSTEKNIKMPLIYSKKNDINYEKHFNEIVDKLKIRYLLDEKINYLSGGEKQRIAIARAFINNPNIIICDEPTGNLDDDNSQGVMLLIKNFLSKDKLIIIVTHDSSLANECDVILKLEGGKLYEK